MTMYNRYLPQDNNHYEPVSTTPGLENDKNETKKSSIFASILRHLKPDQWDKGDLLLAAILLLLYLDSDEEEYLFAMILLFLL